MFEMFSRFQKSPRRYSPSRGLLLFLLPLPVLLAAIISLGKGHLPALVDNAFNYGLYLVGALMARRGFYHAAEYERRKIASAPKPPLKTLGGLIIAAATSLTALGAGYSAPVGICFGLGALLGYYLVYGFDPRAEKRVVDSYGVDTTEQVLAALQRAEGLISAIEDTSRRIRNQELNARLNRIAGLARQILTAIEEDPRDLRRARKFLNVYLEGAQQVTEGYARTHPQTQSRQLEDNFRRVLVSIEDVFQEQQQKLLEQDVQDLDVQIEVLATQLKREGVI